MSLRHALIGLLAYRPRTGYDLVQHFKGSLNYAWPAQQSQIYPELQRLLEAGLIRQTGSGPRGAKTYEPTDAGLAEVRRWLAAEPRRRVRSEAALRVFFLWLQEPDEALAALERERDVARALLAEYEAIRDREPEPADRKQLAYRIALESGIRSARARLDWAGWAIEAWRAGEPAARATGPIGEVLHP